MASRLPLVVIVGPTASGKTGLAIRLAKEFGGEIISADSRAVYRGLDIGTAKPSAEERQGVPHWGFDLVNPGERFTAADFKLYANQKMAEIRSRGKIPFLVGGTGLYIDAVVYDFDFPEGGNDTERRDELDALSFEELYKYCTEHNISLPQNYKNKRYVINAILRNSQKHKRNDAPIDNTIIVGITTENNILRERIIERSKTIFSAQTFREAEQVAARFGWDNEAMTGNIYPLIHSVIDGKMTRAEAESRFVTLDWRLAKRQKTWLKRSEHIQWYNYEKAYTYLARRLAALNKSC